MILAQTQDRVWALALLLALPVALAAQGADKADVEQDRWAQYHWVMHCRGCHGVEGQGSPDGAPSLVGNVARFLQLEAGRAYLARVPGIAFVELSDAEVAALLNWLVRRFDGEHLPKTFRPYSEEEVRALRADPLISNSIREREKLLQALEIEERASDAQVRRSKPVSNPSRDKVN